MIRFVIDCKALPDEILNGKKIVRKSKAINVTHSIDVRVEYKCNAGFTYTSDNPIINCDVDNGLDNSVGECLKGKLFEKKVNGFFVLGSPKVCLVVKVVAVLSSRHCCCKNNIISYI